MKQEKSIARWSRTLPAVCLIVLVSAAFVRAQVTPTVCFEPKPETFTRTATANFDNIFNFINLNQAVPHGFYALVINPGGATEERLTYVRTSSQTLIHPGGTGLPGQTFQFNHLAGETILLIAEGDAIWGYKNSGSTAVTIPRGVSSSNYFSPGNLIYASQPNVFQPGVNENVMSLKVLAAFPVTWTLNNQQATSNTIQECATITYQGRLSDAGNAANGQFDLQFQSFDAETGGAAQSGLITLENVQVTNGIFTVPLKFGSSFANNFKARFLEIKVRPGSGNGNDPFTALTPRQPITAVPYAVNAQNSLNAATATTAITATNATQLGGIPAANYVTNTNLFGQSVTTVSGTSSLTVTNTMTAYTLVPGLTQTVNLPANSSLLISTDGGIRSNVVGNSFSIVDVAIFVDGALMSERRVTISNALVAFSIGNWALSDSQTLTAGNHTIEVRVMFGGGDSSTVSSNSEPLLRGKLTVAVIKN